MQNVINILDIPENTKYWFVRANSQSQYYDDFRYNNFIAVDSNGFKLSTLFEIPSTIRSSEAALLDKYKQLFEEYDLKKFNSTINKKEYSEEELKKEQTKELRRSSNRSSRIFHFVEEMNINDFVIVPYKSSEKFLVGIVTSECFTKKISHLQLLNDEGQLSYDICPFPLKRRVLWVKELSRSQFPGSLSWIKTAHQSIFDITDYADKLNPYINPLYRYKNKINCRLGINTTKNISSTSWLNYQLLLKKLTGEQLDNLYQKQKVQSPGDIILYVTQNYWWVVFLVLGGLFGEIEFNHGPVKVKFQGIIRYFSKSEKLKRKLSADRVLTDLIQTKADIDKTDAETLAKLNEITDDEDTKNDINEGIDYIVKSLKARQENNSKRLEEAFSEYEEKEKITPTKVNVESDAEKVVSDLKISNEDPGSLIQYESQKDSLNIPKEESDKREETDS